MSDIIIQNLTKAYGGKQVYKDYNLVLKAGQIHLFKGKSGSGKTTLFRIISGLEKKDFGEIFYQDNEKKFSESIISYCFQEDRLLENLSAQKNISILHKGIEAADIIKHLSELGIEENDQSIPVSQLSGGMKKRVALARAVLFAKCLGADILILDEPFVSLDEENKKLAISYIEKHRGGVTTLIASHETNANDFTDKVGVIE